MYKTLDLIYEAPTESLFVCERKGDKKRFLEKRFDFGQELNRSKFLKEKDWLMRQGDIDRLISY